MVSRNFEKTYVQEKTSFAKKIYLILLKEKNKNLLAGVKFVHPNKIHIKKYTNTEPVRKSRTFVIVIFDDRKLFKKNKNRKFPPTKADIVISLTDLQRKAANNRGRSEKKLEKFILEIVFQKLDLLQDFAVAAA